MRSVLAAALVAWVVAPPSAPAEPGIRVDLSRPSSSTNVTRAGELRLGTSANRAESLHTGLAVYELPVTRPANTFAASVDGTVPPGAELAVDVRAAVGGQWSEWTEARPSAPAVLPAASRSIEVRVMLSAPHGVESPELRSLTVTPSVSAPAPAGAAAPAGLSYRVFATREGLVGGTTANGHVITKRDHFVALPSRRGLSRDRAGEYSVRVCAANGRCEWAPVWDVGPWNTRDDYWNPPGVRQEWRDLPQGRPQAQAAYQDGYNGGRDQFGRRVANPAGIDLADGTFWDGLLLTDNAWVTVTYQWTGTAPAGYVRTKGAPLDVRAGPGTGAAIVGMAANHAQVRVECRTEGELVHGTQGRSSVWYRLAPGKFAPAAFVTGGSEAAPC